MWTAPQSGRPPAVSIEPVMTFEIDVKRVPAVLHNFKAETYQAIFFVHLVSAHGHHVETIGERLNDPELDFLPIEIEDTVKLVRITSIVFVEFADTPPEVQTLYHGCTQRERVQLRLRTGESLSGELVFQAPYERRRVSDILNNRHLRFLILVDEGRTYYIQRDAIDEVDLRDSNVPEATAGAA